MHATLRRERCLVECTLGCVCRKGSPGRLSLRSGLATEIVAASRYSAVRKLQLALCTIGSCSMRETMPSSCRRVGRGPYESCHELDFITLSFDDFDVLERIVCQLQLRLQQLPTFVKVIGSRRYANLVNCLCCVFLDRCTVDRINERAQERITG